MMFHHSKHQSTISKAFEDEFALESLKSDRLRVNILIGVIISALVTVLGLALFSFEEFQRAFHGNFNGFLISIATVAGTSVVCLMIERAAIGRLINKQKKVFGFFQYLSAFIETSIPTAGMIAGSMFLGPIYTLFTPAAFIYPIFIVL